MTTRGRFTGTAGRSALATLIALATVLAWAGGLPKTTAAAARAPLSTYLADAASAVAALPAEPPGAESRGRSHDGGNGGSGGGPGGAPGREAAGDGVAWRSPLPSPSPAAAAPEALTSRRLERAGRVGAPATAPPATS